jgi:hypothetical protein
MRQNCTKTLTFDRFLEFASCEQDTSHNANMSSRLSTSERVNPRHALADDQRVHVVRAFVGLH